MKQVFNLSKALEEKHKETDKSGNTSINDKLKDHHDEDRKQVTIEGFLADLDEADGDPLVIESNLDANREEKTSPTSNPVNLLGEINDQERTKKYRKAQDGDNDKATKGSQLHNSPERFKGLTTDGVKSGNPKVKEMIFASLKDADSMLYFIERRAKLQNRLLNEEEIALINGINADKTKSLRLYFDHE